MKRDACASDFLPEGSVDGESEFAFFPFETGLVVHVVLWVTFVGGWSRSECGLLVHEAAGHVEIVSDVCPVVDEPPRLDDSGKEFGEGGVEDASFVMSSFPPWVREVDMSGVHGVGRDELGKGVGGITAEDAGVGKLPFVEFISGTAGFGVVDFESGKVDVWVLESSGEDEETASAADVELDGIWAVEEGIPVEAGADVIERLEPWMEGFGGLRWLLHGDVVGSGGWRWRIRGDYSSLSGFCRREAFRSEGLAEFW